MIIQLDNNTRIRGTENCWQLEREHIAKGGSQWKARGYFSTFESAVLGAYRREIRTHHAEGLQECLAAAEEALTRYKTILDSLELGDDGKV